MSAMVIIQKLCRNVLFILFKHVLTLNDFLIGRGTRSVLSFRTAELLCSLLSQFCAVNTECLFYHLLEQRNRIDSLFPPGHHVADAAL